MHYVGKMYTATPIAASVVAFSRPSLRFNLVDKMFAIIGSDKIGGAIDAHGLGVLLELRRDAESNGIEFRLLNVTRLVGRVLEITRLNSVFNLVAERDLTEHKSAPISACRLRITN